MFDHNSYDQPDEDDEQIPGVELPAATPLDDLEELPPQWQVEQEARLTWDCNVSDILERYSQIGVSGSAANQRFVQMFRSLGGLPNNPVAVADLVMIYPPRESEVW